MTSSAGSLERPGQRRALRWVTWGALLLASGAVSGKGPRHGGAAPAGPPATACAAGTPESLGEQRRRLLEVLTREHVLSSEAVARVRAIFERSLVLGQGNPRISRHPITREQCAAAVRSRPLRPADARCAAPYMVVLYDPAQQSPAEARTCIDQFEFPDVPCEYPIVHVRADEAAGLCKAIGKRLCDAHEWEGACAGALHPPATEYAWGNDRASMRALHNSNREIVWAYGREKDHSVCATQSLKSPGCPGSGYAACGSNTAPAGSFPACVSRFGAYDLHGNVAEHMSLPLTPQQLGSQGGHGATEMKGSWFVFGHEEAHPDDCRWRAPDWHGSRVLDPRSHSNYHLGFRCCKDL